MNVLMQDAEDDPILTPEQMAKILPMHPHTIIQHIKSGDLEGYQIGRKYFAHKSKFRAWIKNHAYPKSRNRGDRSVDPSQ